MKSHSAPNHNPMLQIKNNSNFSLAEWNEWKVFLSYRWGLVISHVTCGAGSCFCCVRHCRLPRLGLFSLFPVFRVILFCISFDLTKIKKPCEFLHCQETCCEFEKWGKLRKHKQHTSENTSFYISWLLPTTTCTLFSNFDKRVTYGCGFTRLS